MTEIVTHESRGAPPATSGLQLAQVKWEEIETAYPRAEPPAIDWRVGIRHKKQVQRAYIDALLTHFARSALGFAVAWQVLQGRLAEAAQVSRRRRESQRSDARQC